MAIVGSTAVPTAASQNSSSYRVKFRRNEFLGLVEIASSGIIYHSRRIHFFAFDGFVMYTFDYDDVDYSQPVINAI